MRINIKLGGTVLHEGVLPKDLREKVGHIRNSYHETTVDEMYFENKKTGEFLGRLYEGVISGLEKS